MEASVTDHDDNPDWSGVTLAPLDTALKLQAVRARLRISQSQLAELLHVPLATLRNWEQKRTEPGAFARHMIDVIYDDPEGMRNRLDRRDRRTAA
jgi:putative transcriptional regulator